MSLFGAGTSGRFEVIREFYRMVRDRKSYILIPLLCAMTFVLIFIIVGEMPVLIPFFYAVF